MHLTSFVSSVAIAAEVLKVARADVMVPDIDLAHGLSFAMVDYAAFRHLNLPIVCFSDSPNFTDRSLFNPCTNACAFMRASSLVENLMILVAHHVLAA